MYYIKNHPIFFAETKNPEALKEWREYPYSLTDKLSRTKKGVQLELLDQKWIKTTWWDKWFLRIDEKLVFQREILMKHQGMDYWYARTIIPQACYHRNPALFKRLEYESLRNLVFESPGVHRVELISYPVDENCTEFHWVKKHLKTLQGVLWIRLSEFSLDQLEPFYLIELLLPELEKVA